MSGTEWRNKKTAGKIFIVTGSFIIIFVIAVNVIDLAKSKIAIHDFKTNLPKTDVESVEDHDHVISQDDSKIVFEKEEPVDEPNEPNEPDEPDEKTDEQATLCLLRIPKIRLEEAVKEGSTKGVLASALGHIENTAQPGEDGNCCIAGHRNYIFGKYFNRLNEVTPGDIIELETRDGLYAYEVVSTEVVEPEEVRVLADAEGKNLTLITCTPFMVGTHRLIVHAILK